jgi:hypothetical protein
MTTNSLRGLLLAVLVPVSSLFVSAGSALADTCEAGSEGYISGGTDIVNLVDGGWQNNVTDIDQENGYSYTFEQGESATWTSSASGAVTAGNGDASVSLTQNSSESVTLTMSQTVTHSFAIPARSSIDPVFVVALGISTEGTRYTNPDCSTNNVVDRVTVSVVRTGFQMNMRHPDGSSTTDYAWPETEFNAVPHF